MTNPKKRVLFIGIGFYDYDLAIKSAIEGIGYNVDYYQETVKAPLRKKVISKFYGKIVNEINQSDHIVRHSKNDYAFIFVIKCQSLTLSALDAIKAKNPKAKFILYLWDSLVRINGIDSKLNRFDTVYSFDRVDCLNNPKLTFKPLFFRKEFEDKSVRSSITYDLFHLGWFHSDRMKILWEIQGFCIKSNLRKKLMLFTGPFKFMKLILTSKIARKMRDSFVFKPIKFEQNIALIHSSKVVLDISHPKQTGLTMRTIEVLGAKKKLITTNKDVVNYDFYHEDNILVIDRNSPHFNLEFFSCDYVAIDPVVYKKYSIEEWVIQFFNVQKI